MITVASSMRSSKLLAWIRNTTTVAHNNNPTIPRCSNEADDGRRIINESDGDIFCSEIMGEKKITRKKTEPTASFASILFVARLSCPFLSFFLFSLLFLFTISPSWLPQGTGHRQLTWRIPQSERHKRERRTCSTRPTQKESFHSIGKTLQILQEKGLWSETWRGKLRNPFACNPSAGCIRPGKWIGTNPVKNPHECDTCRRPSFFSSFILPLIHFLHTVCRIAIHTCP